MKTDRFDEEFRRKLLGLPADSGPDEVDRIHGFVVKHRPPVAGTGWPTLLGYAVGGLLLLGSLSYNLFQNHTNTQLLASLDSLRTAPLLVHHPIQPASSVNHTDTVYVTRYRDLVLRAPNLALAGAAPKDAQRPSKRFRQEDTESTALVSSDSAIKTRPSGGPQPTRDELVGELVSKSAGSANDPAKRPLRPGESPEKASDAFDKAGDPVVISERTTARRSPDSRSITTRRSTGKRGLTAEETSRRETGSARSRRDSPRNGEPVEPTQQQGPITERQTVPASGASLAAESGTARTAINPAIVATRLEPRSPALPGASARLNRSVLDLLTIQPRTSPTRQPFQIHWPTMSLAKAQYLAGVGFDVANSQLGVSLLGEVRFHPRWSLQAGVRLLSQTGYQYYTAEQFENQERQDFRSLYAPYVPQNYDLLNIDQSFTLLQLPLTVAYHYPLKQHWGLRFGLGTDIDLYARNRITFDYKESSREFEHGLYQSTVPVSLFSTVTVSVGLERSWKKWRFRAGPFISPQLKPVNYRREELNWGAKVQAFWTFR